MQVLLIYVSTKISKPVSIALSAVSSLGVMFTIAMSRNIIIGQSDPISADLVNFANRFESQRMIIRNKENYNRSTEDMYRSKDGQLYGKYKEVRNRLDYSFHSIYSKDRVYFQDRLIDSFLGDKVVNTTDNNSCSFPAKPWIVFTAGAMGAGKSHTIKELDQRGYFPLQSFVTVDPDQIRHNLPEFDNFALYNPDNAGYLTRKECGMISEIIIELALDRGQNVLVDGTLRDADWYLGFFQNIRNSHPNTRIAILHVTAPRESVMENALVSNPVYYNFCL